MNTQAYVPIEENSSLVRDVSSMAIINVDTVARDRYRAAKNRLLSDNERIVNLEKQVIYLTGLIEKLLEIK